MHNDENWSNILCKSHGAHTLRFLKYIWPFFIFLHGRAHVTGKENDEKKSHEIHEFYPTDATHNKPTLDVKNRP